jgi:hypothetical protein
MEARDGLVEIILKRGLEAAMDVIKKTKEDLQQKRLAILADLKSLDKRIADLNEEPARSLLEAEKRVGQRGHAYGILSYKVCIIEILRDNGDRMRSTELYKIAQQHGKEINTIYVAVSRLIRDGKVIKETLPGERGCILKLRR